MPAHTHAKGDDGLGVNVDTAYEIIDCSPSYRLLFLCLAGDSPRRNADQWRRRDLSFSHLLQMDG